MKFFSLVILTLLSFGGIAQADSEPVWIDVRSEREYKADHIEGDVRISHFDIVEKVSALYPDKKTAISLYCAVGGRAQIALNALQEAGYSNVKNVGGIQDARALRQ